jgi:hypothetical protein
MHTNRAPGVEGGQLPLHLLKGSFNKPAVERGR